MEGGDRRGGYPGSTSKGLGGRGEREADKTRKGHEKEESQKLKSCTCLWQRAQIVSNSRNIYFLDLGSTTRRNARVGGAERAFDLFQSCQQYTHKQVFMRSEMSDTYI